MNENENKTAEALLKKIEAAQGYMDAVHAAQAYQMLCQGALNRKQAEATKR
jgi:hypothetical protein